MLAVLNKCSSLGFLMQASIVLLLNFDFKLLQTEKKNYISRTAVEMGKAKQISVSQGDQ